MAENNRQQEYNPGTNRDIQNAQRRFEKYAENRQTRTRLRRGVHQLENGVQTGSSQRSSEARQPRSKVVFERMREFFTQNGQDFSNENTGLLIQPPQRPAFPILILLLAIFKDFLDVVGAATIAGWLLILPITIGISLILFLWTLSRLQKEYMKKHRMRKIFIRLVAFTIECMGYVDVLPLATFFVLLTHFDETKIVKFLYIAADIYAKMHTKLRGNRE